MSEARFKTMRHIEAVRNYIGTAITKLQLRAEGHDQSKLETPEVEIFETYTDKLRSCTYLSPEYKQYTSEMKPALDHHYAVNRHHPEFHVDGIQGMTLIDLIEMLCDWKAASMRHADGDIYISIEMNQKRFNYSDELKNIFIKTMKDIESFRTYHKANES